MSVDILRTSWDQCRSMVQYSFTSTETKRLVRTDSPGRPPRLSHSSWTMRHSVPTCLLYTTIGQLLIVVLQQTGRHCDTMFGRWRIVATTTWALTENIRVMDFEVNSWQNDEASESDEQYMVILVLWGGHSINRLQCSTDRTHPLTMNQNE